MAEYNPSKIIKDGNTYNFRDTTKIPLAGSNAISGSLIPATTDAYDLGGSSYQWNNAYIKSLTINGVACGDILTHNVSEFVNLTNDQTINGSKYFTSLLSKSNTLARGTLPTTNINEDPIFIAADKNNKRTLAFFNYYNTNGDGRVVLYAYNQNTTNYDNIGLVFGFNNANSSKFMYPVITNACDLGTSTNKWKSFNGINPGALSLPGDAYIDIDTTNYVWGSNFTFTPDYDGYCFISIGSSSYSRIISLKTSRGEYYFSNQTDVFRFTFPVYKGKLVTILTNSSGTESVIPTIRVFSCQGNV